LFAETVSGFDRSGNCVIIVFSVLLLSLFDFFEFDSVGFVKINCSVQFSMLTDGLNPLSKRGTAGHVNRCVVELFLVLFFGFFLLIERAFRQVLGVHGLYFGSGVAGSDAVFASALGEHVDGGHFVVG
jgi:hypothetical protein